MKKLILSNLLIFFIFSNSNAQIFQAKGKIDHNFLEIINYKVVEKGKFKTLEEKKFAREIEFEMRNLLISGKVIYNSEASQFIEKVADKLLKKHEQLRNSVRFYLVRSSDINAFTYNNGMIFIHIGLLANIKSEAQLAFIMAHEISHYQLNHTFEKYKQTKTERRRAEKSNKDNSDAFLSLMSYSREKELEADKRGLEIFLSSEYATNATIDVFELLAFADFPFNNRPIHRESFETPFFKISPIVFPDTATSIASEDEGKQNLSTHPNIRTRISELKKGLNGREEKGLEFLVNEKEFNKIKKAALIELSQIYLEENNYINCFYHCHVLLELDPKNKLVLLNQLKSLFFIQYFLNKGEGYKITGSTKKIKGEIQKLYTFFQSAHISDVNGFVLRYSWKIRNQFPKDIEFKKYSNFCIKEFGNKVSKYYEHFLPISEYNDSLFSLNYKKIETKEEPKERFSLIKVKFTKKEEYKHYSISHFAVSDFLNDSNFRYTFETQIANGDLSSESEDKEINPEHLLKDTNNLAVENPSPNIDNKSNSKGLIKRVLVVDINNLFFDFRLEDPLNLQKVKSKQFELKKLIIETGKMNGVDVSVFNPMELSAEDSAILAERIILKKWINDRQENDIYKYNYDDASTKQALRQIMKKYNCSHICFINSIAAMEQKNLGQNDLMNFIISIFIPPLPVYVLYKMFNPVKFSALYIPLYNTTNGLLVYRYEKTYKDLNGTDFLRSEFYNFFYTIARHELY